MLDKPAATLLFLHVMMRPLLTSLLITALLFGAVSLWRPERNRVMSTSIPTPQPLRHAHQLVLVTTPDWNSVTGTLEKFERNGKDAWKRVGGEISVVVGRTGLAWGRGVHGAAPGAGPVKHEGDGKSPAGAFRLSSAFGSTASVDARFIKLPYSQTTTSIECVDDTASTHYNRLVDRQKTTTVDWKSSERMVRDDDQYRWGIVVDHNANTPFPGAGSCIFLHIWLGPSEPTSGCTAMDATEIEELLKWLDPAASPILVQLPIAETRKLRASWGLPEDSQQ